jgi:nitrate reductase gamma subunit
MMIPYIVAYLAIVIFVIAVIARVVMWVKLPMHVRWELYPVAHEAKRAHYGGSYLEESEWWKKPREVSLFGELKVMIPEILFLVAVREHNPKLWIRTFPFHFGLYMVIGCTVLMMLSGLLSAFAPASVAGGFGTTLSTLILITGWAGLCLGIWGALGLLQRRLTDPALIDFTAPADIFNLVFFIVAFGSALLTAILVDSDFSIVSGFVTGLASFNMTALSGTGLATILPVISITLLSLLVVYIPLTHMSHFIGKYFAYHSIRWNDTPNLPGGPEEAKIAQVLSQKVTWAADHIKGEGKKSWADLATESFKKESKK